MWKNKNALWLGTDFWFNLEILSPPAGESKDSSVFKILNTYALSNFPLFHLPLNREVLNKEFLKIFCTGPAKESYPWSYSCQQEQQQHSFEIFHKIHIYCPWIFVYQAVLKKNENIFCHVIYCHLIQRRDYLSKKYDRIFFVFSKNRKLGQNDSIFFFFFFFVLIHRKCLFAGF